MIRWMRLFCKALLYGPDAPMEYAEQVWDKRQLREERRIMRKAGLSREKIEIILEGEAEARAERRAKANTLRDDRSSGKAKASVRLLDDTDGFSDREDESYYGL